jgi:hypothetical protein
MALRAFEFSDRTLAAIGKLADITAIGGKDRVAKLIQDALRTYEWVIFHQAHGRTIIALEQSEVDLLRQSKEFTAEREALGSFVSPEAAGEAREYFETAATASTSYG